MRTPKIVVKRWKWAKGPNSQWVVDGIRGPRGERIRRFHASRDAADEDARRLRSEVTSQGRSALGITDGQRVDALRALEVLSAYGVTLTEAADAYHESAKLLSRSVTFGFLRDEFLAAKAADRRSGRYIADLRSRLPAFGRTFDAHQVASIEAREIDDWLRNLGLSDTSRQNFRKVLHAAFEFARMRGYAAENPVAKTAQVKPSAYTPGILSPDEVAALLNAADPAVRPSLALSAFAGLRNEEVSRITWDKIHLAEGYVKVDAAIAKTNSRRIIPISDNLKAWLAPYAQAEGPVRPITHYPLSRAARMQGAQALRDLGIKATGLQQWPKNALRHSFASYRDALVGQPGPVAEECGNSVAVLKQHYRELVTKAEAEKWFGVFPPASA